MRIAIIHSFYSSQTPSGENNVVNMQKQILSEAGHEVSIVGTSTDDLSSQPGYALRAGINVALGTGISPLEELGQFNPDIVHVHNLFPNISTRWLRSWRGPMVMTIHNFRPLCAAGTLFRNNSTCTLCPDSGQHHGVMNRCYRGSALATLPLAMSNARGIQSNPLVKRANARVFLSQRALTTYQHLGLQPSKRDFVIPNFTTDTANYDKAAKRDDYWMFVGRLTPEKGIWDLIQSWPRQQSLRIYGNGPLHRQIEALQREEIQLMGTRPQPEVAQAMHRAAGLVIPSKWAEGLPTVYLEALSAGCPIIGFEGNSAADDIKEHEIGPVLTSMDDLPEALFNVERQQERFSNLAAQHYKAHYTASAWLERIEDVYRKIQHEARMAG